MRAYDQLTAVPVVLRAVRGGDANRALYAGQIMHQQWFQVTKLSHRCEVLV